MTQPQTSSAQPKPRGKLTNADYMAMTPPVPPGPRFQLINGGLVEMAAPHDPHQVFAGRFYIALTLQADALGIGDLRIAPYDVAIDEFNTYQPDVLFVSNERRQIYDGHGITGAPDVVLEILSDSTRRRDLNEKMPVYLNVGVTEVWVVDLDARTLSIYAGDPSTPSAVLTSTDTLTSETMPGVSIDLAPIFNRALAPA